MNEDNNFGGNIPEDIDYSGGEQKLGAPTGVSAPVLDDIDYVAPSAKKEGPTGVSAPVLDDMSSYIPQSSKKDGPTGVSAPVLDDMESYTPDSSKKGAPTGVSAPVLDDVPDSFDKPASDQLVLSDEDIVSGLTPELKERFLNLPADKQKQVIEMRRTQLGAVAPAAPVSAPVLDEDNYTPPPKKEAPSEPAAPISAPVLDDEPEAPKYVRKFADEDTERAKQEARKSVSAGLTSNQKDSKKSLEMMLQLKEERRAEIAAKGFKVTVVVSLIGILASVCFFLLYSGEYFGLGYKDGMSGISSKVESLSLYLAIGSGLCSLALLSGIGGFKSLASVVYLLFSFIQLIPGAPMLLQHEGSKPKAVLLYTVALIGSITVLVALSASEAIGQFFKREKN
ncbi:MAG: ABC transporter permease [Ruminococcus flavefaciens]|jgi:hypothetical protein|nr:ABC transporter permease [Ruminococcus flavefaciens]